jgi:lipopolysaccharide export system permease protein
MGILNQYIAKYLLQAIIIVLILLTSIAGLFLLLNELKNLGNGDYRLLQVFTYVFMRLPGELYHFSPMIVLLGAMGGVSMLVRHNELVVMRASGMSTYQIVRMIILVSLCVILTISVVGEMISPRLSMLAVMQKENARSGGRAVVTRSGVWFHVNNDFIHVDQVISRDLLSGVTRYEFDANQHLKAVYAADKLIHQAGGWYLQTIRRTIFLPDQTKSDVSSKLAWDLKLNTELFNDMIEPQDMSLQKIVRVIRYLHQNGLQASEYEYAFWQRLSQPIVSLLMVLIGVSLVFRTFQRHQYGKMMLIGILLGVVFFLLNAFLQQLCIVYQLPALGAVLLPLLILSGLAVMLFRLSP